MLESELGKALICRALPCRGDPDFAVKEILANDNAFGLPIEAVSSLRSGKILAVEFEIA
jgi:hypothetical protein